MIFYLPQLVEIQFGILQQVSNSPQPKKLEEVSNQTWPASVQAEVSLSNNSNLNTVVILNNNSSNLIMGSNSNNSQEDINSHTVNSQASSEVNSQASSVVVSNGEANSNRCHNPNSTTKRNNSNSSNLETTVRVDLALCD